MENTKFNNDLPIYVGNECIKDHIFHNGQSHAHNEIELICVKKGNLKCNTGNDIFSLQKGDICFINQKQLHHSDYGKPLLHILRLIKTHRRKY